MDLDTVGVGGQRSEVLEIAGEDRSSRFGQSDDDGVHRRALASEGPKHTGSTGEAYG